MSANPGNAARIRRALGSLFELRQRAKGTGSQSNNVKHPAVIEGGYSGTGNMVTWALNTAATAVLAVAFDDIAGKVVSRAFLYSLTEAQLRLFIDVSVLADGSYAPGTGQRTFKQQDPECMDRFILACILAGQPLSAVSPQSQVTLKKRDFVKPVAAAVEKVPDGHHRRVPKSFVRDEALTGVVWCPTVPNTSWYARRNGHMYFTGNTYSNAESRNRDFLSYSLMPWANAVEDELTSLTPQGQYIEVSFTGLLRADTQTRYQAYSTAIRDGWLKPNEVRLMESLPPLAEGGTGQPFYPVDPAVPYAPDKDEAVQPPEGGSQ
jgi:hypothetical protein